MIIIKKKSKKRFFPVWCDDELINRFKDACKKDETKASECMRQLMEIYIDERKDK